MYRVLLDGKDLYYPGDEEYVTANDVVKLQLNDCGTFECDVPIKNPEYNNIKNRISMLQVLKNEEEIFYGEVRECEKDFYQTRHIYAVGELAFLFDSIQPQAKYQDLSPRQMLETWLNIHNSQVEDKKKFYVGIVTIHDSNDSLYRFTNQETTLDCIREKLCERLEGYLRIRKVNGKRYLDIVTLDDFGKISEQPITFGENLLDYAENISSSEIATACIPRGARLDESPITGLEAYVDIKSVNNGKDYVYIPDAVAMYGWVYKVVSWDDVNIPGNLKIKAENWLKDNQFESMTLDLTALDLSLLDANLDNYSLGDSVMVYSEPHGMERYFPIQSLEWNLKVPSEDRIRLGDTVHLDYISQNQKTNQDFANELESTRQTTAWLQSAIDNATQMMTGSRGGYKVTEFDESGRWLRDLYMNAPSKERATRLMQINMNGIGFSRDGFDGPYKNAWTIDGVLLGEFIKAGSVQAEALSTEYISSVEKQIENAETGAKDWAKSTITTSIKALEDEIALSVREQREYVNGIEENLSGRIKVTSENITAEVTRAKKSEDALSSSIRINAESIQNRVAKGEIASYLTQYYDRVLIAFNNDSKYVQITAGAIGIYDNGVTDSKKRAVFNQNGNHFYRDGYYVGKIGTNHWLQNSAHKGLVFDLENTGKFMAWGQKASAGATAYSTIFCYSRANSMYTEQGLHFGCNLYGEGYTLQDIKIGSISAGGYTAYTGDIPIVNSITDNGNGSISWRYSSLKVRNGIIIGYGT